MPLPCDLPVGFMIHRLGGAAGCSAVDVVPLFLGAGGHVRKDIPVLMARLQAEHPGVQFRLRPAIGEADGVIAAMAAVALASPGDEVDVR